MARKLRNNTFVVFDSFGLGRIHDAEDKSIKEKIVNAGHLSNASLPQVL